MIEGKYMAECFAVMYFNHNKSIECVREEILDIKTNIAEIQVSLQGANEVTRIFMRKLSLKSKNVFHQKERGTQTISLRKKVKTDYKRGRGGN